MKEDFCLIFHIVSKDRERERRGRYGKGERAREKTKEMLLIDEIGGLSSLFSFFFFKIFILTLGFLFSVSLLALLCFLTRSSFQ